MKAYLVPLPTNLNKFENKIINIQKSSNIDENVYSGTRKMTSNNEDFMTELDILEAVKLIKPND